MQETMSLIQWLGHGPGVRRAWHHVLTRGGAHACLLALLVAAVVGGSPPGDAAVPSVDVPATAGHLAEAGRPGDISPAMMADVASLPASALRVAAPPALGAVPLAPGQVALAPGQVALAPRQVALAPGQVAIVPLAPRQVAIVPLAPRRVAFAAPITPLPRPGWDAGQHCLALAIYYEARSESHAGRRAVAEVILNRVASKRFPDDVCAVVWQGAHRRHRCQFSFACDGRGERPRNARIWREARQLAASMLASRTPEPLVEAATHYHADYVRPFWAGHLEQVSQIGRHIFYRHPRPR